MYKGASDKLSHINRVASHATKPHGNGRIDEIPSWAREPEEYYNSIKQQYESIGTRLYQAREKVISIKQKLKQKLPWEEFNRLNHQLSHAQPLLIDLEKEASHLRGLARAAARNAWGAVFYYCAELLLDKETFFKINDEAKLILARPMQEIAPGHAEKSNKERARLNRVGEMRKRRNKVHDRRPGQQTRVVWDDEAGGRV